MNRLQLEKFIIESYNASPEHLWIKYPSFAVFRHKSNKKWFAVIMRINKRRLGLNIDEEIDVVNLKCDMFGVDFFRQEKGIYPAYHMNKNHWLTVALDGSVNEEIIKILLDGSYNLTNNIKKIKNKYVV